MQVSPPAPSPHGDRRSEAQGGPCRDAEHYISQSLQGKGRRGVTVRPQDSTTPPTCYLESPASLPVSEIGVPTAQGWCIHQITVVTSETPLGLASSCQPLLSTGLAPDCPLCESGLGPRPLPLCPGLLTAVGFPHSGRWAVLFRCGSPSRGAQLVPGESCS